MIYVLISPMSANSPLHGEGPVWVHSVTGGEFVIGSTASVLKANRIGLLLSRARNWLLVVL